MHTNTRFVVAAHTLTLLCQERGAPLTSEYIASSVNTNPVVIRRLLGSLRAAGLVTAQVGSGGGWRLARDPETVTLADVYRAVESDPIFPMHHRPPNPRCRVGRNIQQALAGPFAAASVALQKELGRTTLAQVLDNVVQAE